MIVMTPPVFVFFLVLLLATFGVIQSVHSDALRGKNTAGYTPAFVLEICAMCLLISMLVGGSQSDDGWAATVALLVAYAMVFVMTPCYAGAIEKVAEKLWSPTEPAGAPRGMCGVRRCI